jgi:hypothetical protein
LLPAPHYRNSIFRLGVRLELIDYFVVARDQLIDGDTPAVGREFSEFVKIERNELLDLEDVDPLSQTLIFGQDFCGRQGALSCHQDRAMTSIDVFAAPFNDRLTGRRRDVNGNIAHEEIADAAGRSIGRRGTVVLEITLPKSAIQFGTDQVLHHRAGILNAGSVLLTLLGLRQHVPHHRSQTAGSVKPDTKRLGGEKIMHPVNPEPFDRIEIERAWEAALFRRAT